MAHLPVSLAEPGSVRLGGWLGDAAERSARGRLLSFVQNEYSPALAIFEPANRQNQTSGDWYGEHAGKWLVAAAKRAARSADAELAERVRCVGRFLRSVQEPSGAISAYPPSASSRYENPCSESVRTWDAWVQANLMLGLIEAHAIWPEEGFLESACAAASAMARTFLDSDRRLRSVGNHGGLSATIALEPVSTLAIASADPLLRRFADRIVEELSELEGTELVPKCLRGDDIATIGTGKAYQILWNLVGLLRYGDLTQESWCLVAAEKAWTCVRDHHLTPGGGPWGGIAGPKEVFNPKGFFDPHGLVETCSVWSWMQLCRDLFLRTGDARYVEEFEVSALNQLLGAMDPNGEDWCYFTFPNGRRNPTYDWACCKSSGAAALEEIAPLAFAQNGDTIWLNLFGPHSFVAPGISIEIRSAYPQDGSVEVRAQIERSPLELKVRRPSWADLDGVRVDDKVRPIARRSDWIDFDLPVGEHKIEVDLPMVPRIVRAVRSTDHHGQEIVRDDFFAVALGPLSMATGLVDGFKREETVRLPSLNPGSRLETLEPPAGSSGPALRLTRIEGSDILYVPYHEAGGNAPGRWRSTWLRAAWQ